MSSGTSTLLTMMGRTRIRNGRGIMYGDVIGLALMSEEGHLIPPLYISEETHFCLSLLIHKCWNVDVPLVYGATGNRFSPFWLRPWIYAYACNFIKVLGVNRGRRAALISTLLELYHAMSRERAYVKEVVVVYGMHNGTCDHCMILCPHICKGYARLRGMRRRVASGESLICIFYFFLLLLTHPLHAVSQLSTKHQTGS